MGISYQEGLDQIDYEELNELIADIFGTEKAKDVRHTQTIFEHSQKFVFAFEDRRLIGAVRAISDGEWAVIYQLGVRRSHEGPAVKAELLKRLVRQLEGQHIFTIADVGSVSFYENYGFQRTKTAYTYVGFSGDEKTYPHGYFLPLDYKFENEYQKVDLPFPTHKAVEKKRQVQLTYHNLRDEIDYSRVAEIIDGAFGNGGAKTNITQEKVARTKALFDMSEYVSFAFDGDELVGVARAITDGAEEAYIQNVAVDPAYQGYGIGWQVVVNLGEEILQNHLHPFLHTHPGAVGFYQHRGFLRNKTAMDYRGGDGDAHPMPPAVEEGFYLPIGYRFPDEFTETAASNQG